MDKDICFKAKCKSACFSPSNGNFAFCWKIVASLPLSKVSIKEAVCEAHKNIPEDCPYYLEQTLVRNIT